MDGDRVLFTRDVVHKAFVDVGEAGTEAAASAVIGKYLSFNPDEPMEVTVDRPFIFLIRDIETGAFLFIGCVLGPSTQVERLSFLPLCGMIIVAIGPP